MAKRRKARTHRSPRRRRVSGVGSHANMMHIAELAGGTILGGMAGNMIANQLGQGKDPKLVGAAQMVAGYMIASHAKSPLIQGAGVGMLANGALNIAHTMGLIKGIGEGEDMMVPMSGSLEDSINGNPGGMVEHILSGGDDMYPGNAPVGLGGDYEQ